MAVEVRFLSQLALGSSGQSDTWYPIRWFKPSVRGCWANINRSLHSLVAGKPSVANAIKIKIGDGASTSFWHDNWILGSKLKVVYFCLYALESNKCCTIKDRRSVDNWVWMWRRPLRSGAEMQEFNHMYTAINIVSFSSSPDTWVCNFSNHGAYSVRSLRYLLDEDEVETQPTTWCNLVPPKVNFFLWRARLNKLPDKCNLLDKGIAIQNLFCSSCNVNIEDIQHVFFECNIASQVWAYIATWIEVNIPSWHAFDEMWNWIKTSRQNIKINIIIEVICYATLWTLWRFRNDNIFDPSKLKKCHLIDSIVLTSFNWLSSRYKKANLNWNIWLQNPLLSL
ncbi:uncharacterized protein [Rutidosis leptorrhynchoides]|uniref:uncharacterized protein n=1 Tax=Rutidosis leptorrhynchoides TaxID=125765 RepID=UPI003A999C00